MQTRGIKREREQEQGTGNIVSEEEYMKQYEIIAHLTNKSKNLTDVNRILLEENNKYGIIMRNSYERYKILGEKIKEQKAIQFVDNMNIIILNEENNKNKQIIQQQGKEIRRLNDKIDQMVVDDIINFTDEVCMNINKNDPKMN